MCPDDQLVLGCPPRAESATIQRQASEMIYSDWKPLQNILMNRTRPVHHRFMFLKHSSYFTLHAMKFSGSPTSETVQVLWLNFLSDMLGPEALFAGVIPHGCAVKLSRDKKQIIAKCFVKWASRVALQALRFRVLYTTILSSLSFLLRPDNVPPQVP